MAYSPNNEVLVTGGYDQSVKVWDARSRSFHPLQVMRAFSDSVTSVAVTDECRPAPSPLPSRLAAYRPPQDPYVHMFACFTLCHFSRDVLPPSLPALPPGAFAGPLCAQARVLHSLPFHSGRASRRRQQLQGLVVASAKGVS